MEVIVVLSLAAWFYLFFSHGYFWRSVPENTASLPSEFPDVDIIIPARDEAQTILAVIGSLRRQDYPGRFRIVLIDDSSSDNTAELAGRGPNLEVISIRDKPAGWSGKLWALSRGVAVSTAPLLLFTDADILHAPGHLSALVAKLLESRSLMVSEMVRLNCVSLAERTLVPAFVYFFQMLYPFSKVNDPHSGVAAAAGGTVLIHREALNRIGGIEAIKNTLIDDVALAKAVKKVGAIYLGHSTLATSIRPYPGFSDLWNMISRTAFTQLRYSVILLVVTVIGLTLVWIVPVGAILFGHGWTRVAGLAAYCLAVASFIPTLIRYQRRKLWSLLLPLIAIFYMAATVNSALNRWTGSGTEWKNRAYHE
ncbi:MAG: glycosyltransferase [Pseudomonadota bacterium]|nr:glycosyltransferase [Pseudomonadota bacterium]